MAFYDFFDPPSGGFWQKWFGGTVVPILAFTYGVDCIATQDTWWGAWRGGYVHVQGLNACLAGIELLALGLFAHFHYFWGLVDRLEPYSVAGKVASLLVFLASFGLLIVRVGIFG